MSSNQSKTTLRSSVRSFLVQFFENRRKKSEQYSVELEPYMSKGVYTESDAIRPIPKRYPFGFVKVFLVAMTFFCLGIRVTGYVAPVLEKWESFSGFNNNDNDDD